MKISKSLLAKLALFTATIIWGSSFVIIKDTVDSIPPNILMGIRFAASAVILSVVFFKRMKKIEKIDFIIYMPIGVCIFAAYITQTIGITDTTPGKNAFLTAVYCVLVPFISWAATKKRPDIFNISAAFLCIIGIFFVAVTGDFTIGLGDSFTLIGGVFFAIHIVLVSKLAQGRDPIVITVLQFAVSAVCSFVMVLISGTVPNFSDFGSDIWLSMAYLTLACTCVALLCQNIGLKYCDASSAALIMSLEAVFGVLFSVILGSDKLTLRIIIGFILIFISIVISETKLNFIFKKTETKPAIENEIPK